MSSSAPKLKAILEVKPFTYAEAGSINGNPATVAGAAVTSEEQMRHQQAQAFEQGRQAGLQQSRSEFDSAVAQNREELRRALAEFGAERQSYYRRVESEVVGLSLAIARKILHREVQIDPRALAGVVRITLEKLDTGTTVTLRVHPKEATDWRHYLACQMGDMTAPEVQEDAAIQPGECRVETSVGSTEVGLESQLREIETGLLDLLAERPDGSSTSTVTHATPPKSTLEPPAPNSHDGNLK